MAVQNIVEVRKIPLIVTVQIDGAGRRAVSLDICVEVCIVALRVVKNGIVDHRSGNRQPAHHILVDGPKLLEVNGRHVRLLRLLLGRLGRLLHLGGQLLINLLRLSLVHIIPQQHAPRNCNQQHRRRENQLSSSAHPFSSSSDQCLSISIFRPQSLTHPARQEAALRLHFLYHNMDTRDLQRLFSLNLSISPVNFSVMPLPPIRQSDIPHCFSEHSRRIMKTCIARNGTALCDLPHRELFHENIPIFKPFPAARNIPTWPGPASLSATPAPAAR